MNGNGIRGTFHLNSGLTDWPDRIPAAEWKELYRGHEISCHTVLHPTISRCPLEQVALQVLEDRREAGADRRDIRCAACPIPTAPTAGRSCGSFRGSASSTPGPWRKRAASACRRTSSSWKATCHHKHAG